MMYFTSPSNPLNLAPGSASHYIASPSTPSSSIEGFSWTHNVPNTMPWSSTGDGQQNKTNSPDSLPFVVRFTAEPCAGSHNLTTDLHVNDRPSSSSGLNHDGRQMPFSPDPCTSQTATQWELLHKLSSGSNSVNANLHLKRRNSSDEDDDDTAGGSGDVIRRPAKQYISEERVAAKFNQLHIGNEFTNYMNFGSSDGNFLCNKSNLFETTHFNGDDCVDEDEEEDDDFQANLKKDRQLILSNEVKEVLKSKNSVNRLVVGEIEKSTKALVLWTPPIGSIVSMIKSQLENSNDRSKKCTENTEKIDPESIASMNFDEEANEMMDL